MKMSLFVGVCMKRDTTACMWQVKRQLEGVSWGARGQTQVIRLQSRCLYLLNHLTVSQTTSEGRRPQHELSQLPGGISYLL